MHVNRRRMAQEFLNDRQIQVLAPALFRRASEDDMRDVLFANKLSHSLCDVSLRQPDNRGAQVLGKPNIFLQRAAGVTQLRSDRNPVKQKKNGRTLLRASPP